MRGAKGESIDASDAKLSPHVGSVTELLTEIRDNLAQLNALREHEQ